MDLVGELRRRADRMAHDRLPAGWSAEPSLADVGSFGELLTRLRRLDRRSDEALRALGRLADAGQPEVCLVVTAALLPLLIVRCERRPELVGEAVNELAARVVEPAHEPPAPAVANRLLRRVVWRVRHGYGDHRWQVPMPDPARVASAGDADVDVVAVDRVALAEFRRRLAARPRGVEAWAVLAGSASQTSLSSTERTRLWRRRQEVRSLAIATLVA